MKKKLLILALCLSVCFMMASLAHAYTVTLHGPAQGDPTSTVNYTDAAIADTTVYTKAGFYFYGWFKDSDYKYKWKMTDNVTTNMALYAKMYTDSAIVKGIDANYTDGCIKATLMPNFTNVYSPSGIYTSGGIYTPGAFTVTYQWYKVYTSSAIDTVFTNNAIFSAAAISNMNTNVFSYGAITGNSLIPGVQGDVLKVFSSDKGWKFFVRATVLYTNGAVNWTYSDLVTIPANNNLPPTIYTVSVERGPLTNLYYTKVRALDPEGDPIILTYKWYRVNTDGTETDLGTTTSYYQATAADFGKNIYVRVLPADANGKGTSVDSGLIQVI